MNREKHSDLLVVGAGSSGCVLATQLALATDLVIDLVEAGPDYGPFSASRWPDELRDPRRFPLSHDWGFMQEHPSGEQRPEPRARVVGGCSAHNQCAAVWGAPADYDDWAAAGNPGWSHAELEPLLHEVEAELGTQRYEDDNLAGWQRAFVESSLGAGFQRDERPGRTDLHSVVGGFPATIRQRTRWHAGFAFLDGARQRPTLHIRHDLLADRLLLESGRATALRCRSSDETIELTADRFILAAGVYGSPAILLRSGIGPPADLHRIGVPAKIPLEGVGRNLHDHPGVPVGFEPSQAGRSLLKADLRSDQLYQSQVIAKATAHGASAQVDLHLLPYQAPIDSVDWRFEMLGFAMLPQSRGRLTLRSADPADPPWIDFRFLTDSGGHDRTMLHRALELARRVARTSPMRELVTGELEPGSATDGESLDRYITDAVTGYGHGAGTCRMGPASDSQAVVDHAGRVHGVENVFVADASIMPRIPAANTNLTCYVIGRRIASILAQ